MSGSPNSSEQPAPRWLLRSLVAGALVLLAGAAFAWTQRGDALILDLAAFFCL